MSSLLVHSKISARFSKKFQHTRLFWSTRLWIFKKIPVCLFIPVCSFITEFRVLTPPSRAWLLFFCLIWKANKPKQGLKDRLIFLTSLKSKWTSVSSISNWIRRWLNPSSLRSLQELYLILTGENDEFILVTAFSTRVLMLRQNYYYFYELFDPINCFWAIMYLFIWNSWRKTE